MQAIKHDPYLNPHNRFGRRIQFSRCSRSMKKAELADRRAERQSKMNPSRLSDYEAKRARTARKHAANLIKHGPAQSLEQLPGDVAWIMRKARSEMGVAA